MYEIFEKLLEEHNITSYKVSKDANVTQTALSNWKMGKSTPSIKTLRKIADYFGVSLEYLMGYEKTVVPIDQTGGLSPEYINVMIDARDRGYSPEDIKMALNMLDIARGKK